jgi:hypothetical protein
MTNIKHPLRRFAGRMALDEPCRAGGSLLACGVGPTVGSYAAVWAALVRNAAVRIRASGGYSSLRRFALRPNGKLRDCAST